MYADFIEERKVFEIENAFLFQTSRRERFFGTFLVATRKVLASATQWRAKQKNKIWIPAQGRNDNCPTDTLFYSFTRGALRVGPTKILKW